MNGLIANVTILSGSGFYKGDYANGILSEDMAEFSTYAFTPEIVKCPSKDFANRSFMQVTNMVELQKFKNKIGIRKISQKSKKEIIKLDN